MSKKINHKWQRVSGPNLQPTHAARATTNAGVKKSSEFIAACKLANIEPTTRQASKFKNRRGIAYRFK